MKTEETNLILNKLLFESCLSFGRSPKLTNRKINHYIFGTRQKVEVFKLYELRYLLFKMYPLIHNLFFQARLNFEKKKNKWFFSKNFDLKTKKLRNLPKKFQSKKRFEPLKKKFNSTLKEKAERPLPPIILFATTTPIYSEIVSDAAKKCHMPFHVNRWLSGTVTAASYYLDDYTKWFFLTNSKEKKIDLGLQKRFSKHKKNFQQQKNQVGKYQLKRKPTLIIIPDISNNEMILKETNSVGIPALGLVNSHCNNEIAYPIFANDFSLYSIHFFCHFLSSLILKELAKSKHKVYTRKIKRKNFEFLQTKKDFLRFDRFRIQQNSGWRKIRFKYSFPGQYFVNNFAKPRRLRKKSLKIKNRSKFFGKQKNSFSKIRKHKFKFVSPKKIISVENRKRLKRDQINFYLKKKLVSKIGWIQKVRFYNFPKILRELAFPKNKPTFRYWNRIKFWYASPIQFITNTAFGYPFKKWRIKKINKFFWMQVYFRTNHREWFEDTMREEFADTPWFEEELQKEMHRRFYIPRWKRKQLASIAYKKQQKQKWRKNFIKHNAKKTKNNKKTPKQKQF